jgi:hypothetical protein
MLSVATASLHLLLVALSGQQGNDQQVARQASNSELQLERETVIGEAPTEGKHIFRAAVCPDGTVYVTVHDVGRLTTIAANGEVVGSGAYGELEGVASLTCDSAGNVYAGTVGGGLLKVTTDAKGRAAFDALPSTGLVVRSMVYAEGIGLVALGFDQALTAVHTELAIHTFKPGTPPLRSFAREDFAARDGVRPTLDGTILWDRAAKEVLVIPRARYELLSFGPQGGLKKRTIVSGTGFRRSDDGSSTATVRNDQVLGAAMLPDGSVVVEFTELANGRGRTAFQVFSGPERRVLGSSPAPYGILCGADQTGALYWLRVGRGGPISVYKTRLAAP